MGTGRSQDAAILGIVTYYIYLRHKWVVLRHTERMAAMEKGVALPDLEEPSKAAPWTPRVYLFRGLLWLFAGAALTLTVWSIALSTRTLGERSVVGKIYQSQRLRQAGATEQQVQMYLQSPEHDGMPVLAYLLFYRR
ncbi:MAG: hypothetical protein NTY38_21005 [Acidobacteria bacterium]|nr:hypothetical protein [Acidobacteriota bacterium]